MFYFKVLMQENKKRSNVFGETRFA